MGDIIAKFGIQWPTILYVLGNTVLLVVGLYFLLVKPVKKLMAQRKAKAEEVFKENERLNQEVTDTRLKYEKLTADAAERIDTMMKESQKTAENRAADIVEEAKREAREILTESKKEADAERLRLERHFKTEIASLAVDVAAKVLEREVGEKDNAKLVDEVLGKWAN
ncbi:hypothetical protein FACS1894211_05890 [Clostridia bacterium]|nr:hypothetical protein FACS1894211_05890 [Clostridia bacterium]